MSLYGHNPIFHCFFHTDSSIIPPPPNAFVKRFLLLSIKYFIDIPLDFSLFDKDRYRMCPNSQN